MKHTPRQLDSDDDDYSFYSEDTTLTTKSVTNSQVTDPYEADDDNFEHNLEFYHGVKEFKRITAMREAEYAKMTLQGDQPLEQYNDFLDQQAQVFATARLFKDINNSGIAELNLEQNNELIKNTLHQLQQSMITAGKNLETMIMKLSNTPYSPALHAKITLLNKIADDLHHYHHNPKDPENTIRMMQNIQSINFHKNSYWTPLKITILSIVGMACIALGVLSTLPSFGASIGLIALGASICSFAGVKSFKRFMPKVENSLGDNLSKILTKTEDLLSHVNYQSLTDHPPSPANKL